MAFLEQNKQGQASITEEERIFETDFCPENGQVRAF